MADPIRSGRVPRAVTPEPARHAAASNFFATASPIPARRNATGAAATSSVSTTTACGLAGSRSTETRRWASSYMAMAALVGLSFEATVGTVTTGSPSRSETALPASRDLPPPSPTTMPAPSARADAAIRSAAAAVIPPGSSRNTGDRPPRARIAATRSPRSPRTYASVTTSGRSPYGASSPPRTSSAPGPCTYRSGPANILSRLMSCALDQGTHHPGQVDAVLGLEVLLRPALEELVGETDADDRPEHPGVEHGLGDQRAQAAGGLVVLGDDEPPLAVERLQRRHVQHPSLDTAGLGVPGGLQCPGRHVTGGDDPDAPALAQQRGLSGHEPVVPAELDRHVAAQQPDVDGARDVGDRAHHLAQLR